MLNPWLLANALTGHAYLFWIALVLWRPFGAQSHFHVFARYRIINEDDLFHLYLNDDLVHIVERSKTAMSWCIAHYEQRWELASNLIKTDRELSAREFDMRVHRDLSTVGCAEDRHLHLDLFFENKDRMVQLRDKLQKYVNLAKRNKYMGEQTTSTISG